MGGPATGDSNEPFGTAIEAAWRVEQIAVLIPSVVRFRFNEAIEEFIFCRSWGVFFRYNSARPDHRSLCKARLAAWTLNIAESVLAKGAAQGNCVEGAALKCP